MSKCLKVVILSRLKHFKNGRNLTGLQQTRCFFCFVLFLRSHTMHHVILPQKQNCKICCENWIKLFLFLVITHVRISQNWCLFKVFFLYHCSYINKYWHLQWQIFQLLTGSPLKYYSQGLHQINHLFSPFFFAFHFLKPLKFVLGLSKWKFYATEGPYRKLLTGAVFLKSITGHLKMVPWNHPISIIPNTYLTSTHGINTNLGCKENQFFRLTNLQINSNPSL